MTQEWLWILIVALLVVCFGGRIFGMRHMNGHHKRKMPDAGQTKERAALELATPDGEAINQTTYLKNADRAKEDSYAR